MPVNEITAPSFVIVKYTTTARPVGHKFRLYFDSLITVNALGEGSFPSYTDVAHPTGWTVKEVVDEVISRFAAALGLSATQVTNVEMWHSAVGENVFIGYDAADYSGVNAGAGAGIASAYTMYVFQSSTRETFRFTMFDTPDAKPQRISGLPPPLLDNGFIEWFMLRSAVGFVTNDNLPLTIYASVNTGYNKKLARTYGRSVTP